jgi:hypothetical protein
LDVTLKSGTDAATPLTPTAAPGAGLDFGLSIPKASLPKLSYVGLSAHCWIQGGGVEMNRPYHLAPLWP